MKRKLTDTAVKNAKPQENGKIKKYTDGGGMYLQVSKTAKYWRYNYTFAGKQNTLALGVYPEITLKEARKLHEEARVLIAKGVDPNIQKKIQRQEQQEILSNSFEALAREWITSHLEDKSESYRKRVSSYLERDVIPYLGKRPIAEIKPIEVLTVVERIQKRIARDSHLRVLQSIGQIMRYTIATERRLDPDPTASLKGLSQLKPKVLKKHFPAITDPVEVGRLMRAIENYQGNFVTKCALQLSALVMIRPGELIRAEWPEVDLENGIWIIEARRMKADTAVKNSNRTEDTPAIACTCSRVRPPGSAGKPL